MNLSFFYEIFYPLLLLFLFALFIKWIKSKESKWIGSYPKCRFTQKVP
jgi:hypothetical protein